MIAFLFNLKAWVKIAAAAFIVGIIVAVLLLRWRPSDKPGIEGSNPHEKAEVEEAERLGRALDRLEAIDRQRTPKR